MKKHSHAPAKEDKQDKMADSAQEQRIKLLKRVATMSTNSEDHVDCTNVKIYKVKYVINLLPSLAEDQNELM